MKRQEIAYSHTPEFREKLKDVSKVRLQKDWRKLSLEFKDGSRVTVVCKDLMEAMWMLEDLCVTSALDLETIAEKGMKILHKALAEAEMEGESEQSASPAGDA